MSDLPAPDSAVALAAYGWLMTRKGHYIDVAEGSDADEFVLHRELVRHYVEGRLIDGQAIADAPRCEHGFIDEHEADWEKGPDGKAFKAWCLGAPELRALLNALKKNNNDE